MLDLGTMLAVVGDFFDDLVALCARRPDAWYSRLETADERLAVDRPRRDDTRRVVGLALEDTITARLGEPEIARPCRVAGVLVLTGARRPGGARAVAEGGSRGGLARHWRSRPGFPARDHDDRRTVVPARPDAAARLSFLLLVPTVLGAVSRKGLEDVVFGDLPDGWKGPFLVGVLSAWGTGLLAIEWLLGYVRRHTYGLFVVYRLVVAAIIVLLIVAGARSATF